MTAFLSLGRVDAHGIRSAPSPTGVEDMLTMFAVHGTSRRPSGVSGDCHRMRRVFKP
jgi:hypothetical protein